MEKCLLFTCHLIWALYTLKMPNLLNLKELLQNRKMSVADTPIPFLTPFPKRNYYRKRERGNKGMRNVVVKQSKPRNE